MITYYAINTDGTIWAKSTNYDKLAAKLDRRNRKHLAATDVWLGGWIQSYL